MLIYSYYGFSFTDSLFPKLLNSKSFIPTPFNEVDSYVCNTFLFFDHSLNSLLRFPNSLMKSKFPQSKVHSLFYKLLWVFDNCMMPGSHHYCTTQNSFTTLKVPYISPIQSSLPSYEPMATNAFSPVFFKTYILGIT